MITLKRVSKFYDTNTQVLRAVDFSLGKGDFFFVVGDSGAGKTTLLKLMSGEEKPSKGSVLLNGVADVSTDSRVIRSFRKRTGFVHQDFKLFLDRTVLENVSLPL